MDTLIEEAKRKGFKKGVTVIRPDSFFGKYIDFFNSKIKIGEDNFEYFPTTNELEMGGYIIYQKGVWAEIFTANENKNH